VREQDETDWTPVFGPEPGVHLKWGWNAETGVATVWEVTGGPDGLPTHNHHLAEAWGRTPSSRIGDHVGIALATDSSDAPENRDVYVTPYYRKTVPEGIVRWFHNNFPNHTLHVEP
jgi:hypothetical protein